MAAGRCGDVMNYRRLGRTGLQVSEISLGTVELGLDYGVPVAGEHLRPAEADAARLLNRALDLGVNFIDTARAYGASEDVIGQALKSRRREYILASKLAAIREAGQSDRALRDQVKASIAASLRALQTDVIDLLQSHHTPLDVIAAGRVVEAMQEAQAAGDVRFIGASTYGEDAPLAVLEDGRFDTLQVAYSPIDRTLEARVLPLAQQKDIGVVVRSVLLRGVLTHRYTLIPPALAELKDAIGRLDALTGGEVGSLPELAYQYVLDHAAVATALVGTARVAELEAAVAFAEKRRPPSTLVAAIREINVGDRSQLIPSNWPADFSA